MHVGILVCLAMAFTGPRWLATPLCVLALLVGVYSLNDRSTDIAAGSAVGDCVDDDAAALRKSQGAVKHCADAKAQGFCTHASLGPTAKAICPKACGECTPATGGAKAPLSTGGTEDCADDDVAMKASSDGRAIFFKKTKRSEGRL